MAIQGSYPLDGRTLAPTDTVTGVVTGATADIPLNILFAFISEGFPTSGPTTSRPVPVFVGQGYFDTTLGYMMWAKQLLPTIWVNAAGIQE